MSAMLEASEKLRTIADLVQRLGKIPLERIRFLPAPGTATEQDVLEVHRKEKSLCELIDGVLVEKAMGLPESLLAGALVERLRRFVRPQKLGVVSCEGGMMRLFKGLVRIPDVAFISWARLPGGRYPTEPIPDVVPDLAIEVLSLANTLAEMKRKVADYFFAGVKLVWLIDPRKRTATQYTAPDKKKLFRQDQSLSGGEVLPGFVLPLAELFAELDETIDS